MDSVVIVEYDPKWSELFEQEATHLRNLLGNEIVLRVEHFGSTAIPGIPAKPIIDILVEVPSFAQAKQQAQSILETNGYDYLWRYDRPPGHMMFIKKLALNGSRTHHIHIAPEGHKLWERLYFRDYLKSYPNEARQYAQLKLDLAQRFPNDREAYTDGKAEYIKTITDRAKREAEAT